MMILSASQIDRNIAWLLSNGSAPVRYLTHKYLSKTPAGSEEMANLRSGAQTCRDAEEILMSTKEAQEIQRFFYHGHSTVHELLMFSELRVGLEEKPVRAMLEWLMTMYRTDEGCFRYTGKPIAEFSRRQDGMDARVARYRLYHLLEDDWLTYYGTRIGANLINR